MIWETEVEELAEFAGQFWEAAGDARTFAFHGEMGAGKTTTIAALCGAKGITDTASSPTFSIINQYEYAEHGARKTLYHIDLYRLKDEEEVQSAGIEDCVYSDAVCFVEWPEKAPWLFDEATLHVLIKPLSDTRRSIQLVSHQEFSKNGLEEQL